jgi:NAD-dependent SIR2 family protein deacetylase
MPTPPLTPATVHGLITAVPCAHCGVAQNYTDVIRELEGSDAEINGASIECEKCGKNSEIVDVRKVVVVRQA